MLELMFAIGIYMLFSKKIPDNKGKRRAQHLATSFAPKK